MREDEIKVGKISIPKILFAGLAGFLTLLLGYLNYYNARHPVDKSTDQPRFVVVPDPYVAPDGFIRIQVENDDWTLTEDLTVRIAESGLEYPGLGKHQPQSNPPEWIVHLSELSPLEPGEIHNFEFRFPNQPFTGKNLAIWVTNETDPTRRLLALLTKGNLSPLKIRAIALAAEDPGVFPFELVFENTGADDVVIYKLFIQGRNSGTVGCFIAPTDTLFVDLDFRLRPTQDMQTNSFEVRGIGTSIEGGSIGYPLIGVFTETCSHHKFMAEIPVDFIIRSGNRLRTRIALREGCHGLPQVIHEGVTFSDPEELYWYLRSEQGLDLNLAALREWPDIFEDFRISLNLRDTALNKFHSAAKEGEAFSKTCDSLLDGLDNWFFYVALNEKDAQTNSPDPFLFLESHLPSARVQIR